MKKGFITIGHGFEMEVRKYALLKVAILGLPDSGKSYTALQTAEQLLNNNIPIVAFDPSGVWWSLKMGKKDKKGYDIVVIGGEHADIALHPSTVRSIIAAAVKEGISVVFDLSGQEVETKAAWRKIAKDVINYLFYHNIGLRHIFLEEAKEFIPQVVYDQDVFSAFDKTIRIGRNKGLGITIINQRAASLNKEAYENCNMNIIHTQEGKNSLKSIKDWFVQKNEEANEEIMKSLPFLPQGQCWIIASRMEPVKIKVFERTTFHPNPLDPVSSIPKGVKQTDVHKFVDRITSQLKEQEKELLLQKDLEKEIAELKKQLRQKTKPNTNKIQVHTPSDNKIAAQYKLLQTQLNQAHSIIANRDKSIKKLQDYIAKRSNAQHKILNELVSLMNNQTDIKSLEKEIDASTINYKKINKSDIVNSLSSVAYISDTQTSILVDPELKAGEKIILTAIVQNEENGADRTEIGILTSYKPTSRNIYIGKLKSKGYVINAGDKLIATDAGLQALGDYERLPKGKDLQIYWLNRLSGGEKRILEILVDHYPEAVKREDIDQLADYKPTSRNIYLGKLLARHLVKISSPGKVIVSDKLF